MRWEIYLVNLDPTIGSEQGKTRPVLVISDDDINAILPVINILPLTSLKQGRKIYPNEVLLKKEQSGLDKDSLVLCYQIRTVDKKRLIKKLGEVKNDDTRTEIIDALSFQLGL
ncbi:MAG: type II toxin-antitoxin system PemK/MazF family toxin [Methylococcales bacterium]|nr:type II toxin-antitoxin system PemK/MazF family toxin [Methylococcales bacterium]